MKILFAVITLFLYAKFSAAVGLLPGERIARDPVNGNYTAIFWDEDEDGNGGLEEATFETATKVEPMVRSRLQFRADWGIGYYYQVGNGKGAKQAIVDFDLYGLPLNIRLLNTRQAADANGKVQVELYNFGMQAPLNTCWYGSGASNGQSVNLGWSCKSWDDSMGKVNTTLGIAPGGWLNGIGLASADLPGISRAKFIGNTKWHQFSFSGPGPNSRKSDIGKKMGEVEANDFVARNVAAPMISVPTPFVVATVVDNLRAHVATWSGKQLVEVVFAGQLDRYLVAAADAFRRNQAKAGKEHLEKVRELLKQASPHFEREDEGEQDEHKTRATPAPLIDKLAAQVLDFDVQYVLQRSEAREGEQKK